MRKYQKSHGCFLISRTHLHVEHLHLKPRTKKKVKEAEPKGVKDRDATMGVT
jgi:hypothetical protein